MSIDNLPRRPTTREEARRRTDEFKVHTEAWLEELAALYIDQVWRALDYETFDEYCAAELGSIRLPRAGRTEAVQTLREAGLSIRAISSALGLGVGTIHREIEAGVPNGTPDLPNGPQKETIGRDGKHYPASSPTPDPAPEPEVVEAEVVEAEPEPPPPETKKKAAEPQPPPPDVTQPEPEPPYHRPIDALVDELGVIVAQLERHVESEDFTDLRNRRRHWFTTGASGVIESLSRRLADVTTHLSSAQRTRPEWARLTSAEKCRWGRAYDEGADPVDGHEGGHRLAAGGRQPVRAGAGGHPGQRRPVPAVEARAGGDQGAQAAELTHPCLCLALVLCPPSRYA